MRRVGGFTQRWAVFVIAVVVWQLVTAAAENVWFPTPLQILDRGRELWLTNENGGWSSWTQSDARPSRRMLWPFTVSAPVLNRIVSPSSAYQTGATCGRPSLRVVASSPGRTGSRRNASHSSLVIAW